MESKTPYDNRIKPIFFAYRVSVTLLMSVMVFGFLFSLFGTIYLFAVNDLIPLARLGIILLKLVITFILISAFLELILIVANISKIRREQFQTRRNILIEEIKNEIKKEIKNVRHNRTKR